MRSYIRSVRKRQFFPTRIYIQRHRFHSLYFSITENFFQKETFENEALDNKLQRR